MTRIAIGIACLGSLVAAAVALAAPGDPKRKLNPVDNDVARSLLLRPAELPSGSWDAKPTDFSQANPDCIVLRFNLSALTVTGEAGYTYAPRGGGSNGGISYVESDAHLFLDAAQASRAFATIARRGFASCIASALVDSLQRAGYTVTLRRTQTFAMHALNRSVTAGFRIVLRVNANDVDDTQLALLRGREFATVDAFGTGTQKVVNALAAKIASRLTSG